MRLEFLLAAREFTRPRQFGLEASTRLDGQGVAKVLNSMFGQRPWFCAGRPLEEHPAFSGGNGAMISDIPRRVTAPVYGVLQLYVPDGPNAGAHLPLTPGTHPVGRCAPLWLDDPQLGRVHATVHVDHRSITMRAEPGHSIIWHRDQEPATLVELQLKRGSRLRLGDTVLVVDDPVRALGPQVPGWPDPLPEFPQKPEAQRLLTLLAAAAVPVVIGVLLAVTTGSKLFLIMAGLSAVLGSIPALSLLHARRDWKRQGNVLISRLLELRRHLAPALGTAIAAGASAEFRHCPGQKYPPLVFGSGLWDVAAGGAHKTAPEPHSSTARSAPVFALSTTGAWQLSCARRVDGLEVLAALLARMLPSVVSGGPELVLDRQLEGLPAALLLLPNVRLGTLPDPAVPEAVGPLKGRGEKRTTEAPSRIYLLCGPARPVPGALVLGLDRVVGDTATHWINLDTLQANLDDPQARLLRLDRLRLDHFARLVEAQLWRVDAPAHAPVGPPDIGASLGCVLGENAIGTRISLDFVLDGPHVLVAGTTGAGKSEALRRIVAELTARYGPRELALILVDFKGGASLSVFAGLPHTQLFSSDLDAAGALRTIEQLEREITRRERQLREHGCDDILHYHLLDGKAPPLPRLVVVVDEFRVFLDELPEAAARIDRVATVGRALGIHLLLSTQRPGGTLSGQARANVNAVIALRVREPSESNELVGTPRAAELATAGEAVLRVGSGPPRLFRFNLAGNLPAHGALSERSRFDFRPYRRLAFGQPPDAAGAVRGLQERVAAIALQWQNSAAIASPFAPPLPLGLDRPASVPSAPQAEMCGLVDNLAAGKLLPLLITPPGARTLLACGLPEAGTAQLTATLLGAKRRILCFDPSPLPGYASASNLVVVGGREFYHFIDALDYLEREQELSRLLVVVRNLAGLCAAVPAAEFSRFDETLGSLIRRAEATGVGVAIIGDRDITILKASGLCSSRWYFPLGAPQALQMTWPKLPPVSPAAGRGVAFDPEGHVHSIQLLRVPTVTAPEHLDWRPVVGRAATRDALPVGSTGLLQEPVDFRPERIGFVLVSDPRLRREIARVLCARWDIELLAEGSAAPATPGRVGILHSGALRPEVAAWITQAPTFGAVPIIFCAPSARLSYDFGLPGAQLDERAIIVVEATHPFDVQPLGWRPLSTATNEREQDFWRALMLVDGRPREVRIPRR